MGKSHCSIEKKKWVSIDKTTDSNEIIRTLEIDCPEKVMLLTY